MAKAIWKDIVLAESNKTIYHTRMPGYEDQQSQRAWRPS